MIGALALVILGLQDPAPRPFVHSKTSEYKRYEMSGFVVLASPAAVNDRKACDEALGMLYVKLAEVRRILPRAAYEKLKGTKVWVERDNPELIGAAYHPSAEWLRMNGFNKDKEKGVEIGNIRNFVSWNQTTQPMMVVHELAHAYHHQVLGFDNKRVDGMFQSALAAKTYEKVSFVSGGERRHYALENAKEFFAEASEAYFGCNDFFPFDRRQLAAFDKETYAMLAETWGLQAGESKEIGSSATPEVLKGLGRSVSSSSATATGPRSIWPVTR